MGQLSGIATVIALVVLASVGGGSSSVVDAAPATLARRLHHVGADDVRQACIQSLLGDVLYKCDGTRSPNSTTEGAAFVRGTLVAGIQACLELQPSGTRGRPVRILLPGSIMASLLTRITDSYADVIDSPIVVDAPTPLTAYIQKRVPSIAFPSNLSVTHEAWLVAPSSLGDGLASGAYADLTSQVVLDQRLAWHDLLPSVKSIGLVYQGKVLGLPLSTYTPLLFYRKDVFEQNGWDLPHTWQDLAQMAARINGTNGMHGFCAEWSPCVSIAWVMVRLMLTSYHQTLGLYQGWLIDPETMKPLFDSPALIEVIEIIRTLYRLSPPDLSVASGCSQASMNFQGRGNCLMTLSVGTTFKYISHISRSNVTGSLQGNLGVALLPGSDRVLDRATNTLVPCTETLCPFATRYINTTHADRLVNLSPGFDGNLFAINAKSPAEVINTAEAVLQYVASRPVSGGLVYHPDAEVFPSRASQLSPSTWAAAGFNAADSRQYCVAHQTALNHPNMHAQVRFKGSNALNTLLQAISINTTNTLMAAADIAKAAQARAHVILAQIALATGGAAALKADYFESIDRFIARPPPPMPPSPEPPVLPQTSAPEASSDNELLAIVLSSVLASAAAVALLILARRTWLKGGLLSVSHPGAGPNTTLLVTDIENSTDLWEQLAAGIMDQACVLHNNCVRALAAKHHGYESVWEGDSFTIAFPTVQAAVQFSMACQKQLLTLPWPPELLQSRSAEEVWLQHRRPSAAVDHNNGSRHGMRAAAPRANANNSQTAPHPVVDTIAPNSRATSFSLGVAGLSWLNQAESFGVLDPFANGDALSGASVHSARSAHFAEAPDIRRLVQHSQPSMAAALGSMVQRAGSSIAFLDDLLQPLSQLRTGQQQAAAKTTVATATVGSQMQQSWLGCEPDASGAMLCYKGLRVRIGMHSGVHSATDIRYSSQMRRYHYAGEARLVSAAVASAGHGGQILLSGEALALLDSSLFQSAGRLLHLGLHQLLNLSLLGAEHRLFDLYLLLPVSLQCRAAYHTKLLRNTRCVLPGAAGALMPWCAPGPGPVAGPYLVGLKLVGLPSLYQWDVQEAQRALQTAYDFLVRVASEKNGVLCEDGWGEMLRSPDKKAHTRNGTVVIALSSARCALQCASALQIGMLQLKWSERLLSHEECETVGALAGEVHDMSKMANLMLRSSIEAWDEDLQMRADTILAAGMSSSNPGLSNARSSIPVKYASSANTSRWASSTGATPADNAQSTIHGSAHNSNGHVSRPTDDTSQPSSSAAAALSDHSRARSNCIPLPHMHMRNSVCMAGTFNRTASTGMTLSAHLHSGMEGRSASWAGMPPPGSALTAPQMPLPEPADYLRSSGPEESGEHDSAVSAGEDGIGEPDQRHSSVTALPFGGLSPGSFSKHVRQRSALRGSMSRLMLTDDPACTSPGGGTPSALHREDTHSPHLVRFQTGSVTGGAPSLLPSAFVQGSPKSGTFLSRPKSSFSMNGSSITEIVPRMVSAMSSKALRGARSGASIMATTEAEQKVRILHAPMLRGLRCRMAVCGGPVKLLVAGTGTGRSIYTGKGRTLLQKLLQDAKPGQIRTTAGLLLQVPGPAAEGLNPAPHDTRLRRES